MPVRLVSEVPRARANRGSGGGGGRHPTPDHLPELPHTSPCRTCDSLMIAKTYVFAKTFGIYTILFLREAKSLRDHGLIMVPGVVGYVAARGYVRTIVGSRTVLAPRGARRPGRAAWNSAFTTGTAGTTTSGSATSCSGSGPTGRRSGWSAATRCSSNRPRGRHRRSRAAVRIRGRGPRRHRVPGQRPVPRPPTRAPVHLPEFRTRDFPCRVSMVKSPLPSSRG
jgi:hypothetical protein